MTDNILNWEQIDDSSFGSTTINIIATDNTIWVAAGEDGKLATATNPTGTWTQRTSSFGSSFIKDIATDGTTWVAVGYDGKMATATDPTGTWTQVTDPSFSTTHIISISTDNNGMWVAVGWYGKIATATDPTGTWTQRTNSFSDNGRIRSIINNGTIWVAGGWDDMSFKLITATDPTGTWTLGDCGFPFMMSEIITLATDGTTWVTIGNENISTTTNPTGTWTLLTDSGLSFVKSIVANKRNWVAVCTQGKLATTKYPTSLWTQRTSSFGTTIIWSIATNGITWVAVGESGKMAINTGDIKESFPMFLPNL